VISSTGKSLLAKPLTSCLVFYVPFLVGRVYIKCSAIQRQLRWYVYADYCRYDSKIHQTATVYS